MYVTLYVIYMIQHLLLALWNFGLCHRYRECQKLKYTSKKPSTVSKSCMYACSEFNIALRNGIFNDNT